MIASLVDGEKQKFGLTSSIAFVKLRSTVDLTLPGPPYTAITVMPICFSTWLMAVVRVIAEAGEAEEQVVLSTRLPIEWFSSWMHTIVARIRVLAGPPPATFNRKSHTPTRKETASLRSSVPTAPMQGVVNENMLCAAFERGATAVDMEGVWCARYRDFVAEVTE